MTNKEEKAERTRLNLVLDTALDERFRRAVFEKKGLRKGDISKAVEEALEDWINKKEK
jgi:hypothetical protein